ncbi:hypothetical protein VOLCADRAFT_87058 [Volvox carteri f. nagariensis]|uniref:BTB domain-containing protein n=1 Tax=Volvox carteri f. nagariensis TaxID=3068 RepID=D8TK24_VOLCA|nr:uncharacterized protein VOLCADRAFT_87058 [Volvox carteri f. nagariensis]EFJ52173.1 hypothetical protein VOLCADRAFT_87058 [Volvox carteri f. nagariensis]|eukprot:XP_002946947.1 hypothetical protein VOLCADRAFT_87058 [Volvox carteri f. nagariensis]
MTNMEQITLSTERVTAVFVRKLPGGAQQALVCTERGIQPLLGLEDDAAGATEIRLGPPLALMERTADGRSLPYTWSPPPAAGGAGDNDRADGAARAPVYAVGDVGPVGDGCLCFVSTYDTIVRLDADGHVELVAGQPGCPGRRDGPGGAALVRSPLVMAPDGTGGVFFSDGSRDCVRRARLAAPPPRSAAPPSPVLPVTVATLPFQIPDWSLVHALSYDYAAQVLYVCTPRMVYHAVGVGTASGTAAPGLQPVAGGEEGGGSGCVDGVGRAALFGSICDAVVDSRGSLYVIDMEGPGGGAVVRRVDPAAGGVVQTLPSASLGYLDRAVRLAILPGGWLCLYEWGGNKLWMLQLGLEPSRPGVRAPRLAAAAAAPAVGPDLGGLADDFGALLTDPWHIADVIILAGDNLFPAHSQVLIARCEYFRRRLLQTGNPQDHVPVAAATAAAAAAAAAGSGGDGSGADVAAAAAVRLREVPLADADPEAVAQLLRYIYTGSVDFPDLLLRPVLELANRLLLPRLAAAVQQQLHQKHPPMQPPPAAVYDTAAGTEAEAPVPPAPNSAVHVTSGGDAAGLQGDAPGALHGAQVTSPWGSVGPTAPTAAMAVPLPLAEEKEEKEEEEKGDDDDGNAPSAPPAEAGQPLQPLQTQQRPSQPLSQPQLQPYTSYCYTHRPVAVTTEGTRPTAPSAPAAPPTFLAPPTAAAYGATQQTYNTVPGQMYGTAPPLPSAAFSGGPSLEAGGYGFVQPTIYGNTELSHPYGAHGLSYTPPPVSSSLGSLYGSATTAPLPPPPNAGYGMPLPLAPACQPSSSYPMPGYPPQMYGDASHPHPHPQPPPPPGGGYYYPPFR